MRGHSVVTHVGDDNIIPFLTLDGLLLTINALFFLAMCGQF